MDGKSIVKRVGGSWPTLAHVVMEWYERESFLRYQLLSRACPRYISTLRRQEADQSLSSLDREPKHRNLSVDLFGYLRRPHERVRVVIKQGTPPSSRARTACICGWRVGAVRLPNRWAASGGSVQRRHSQALLL